MTAVKRGQFFIRDEFTATRSIHPFAHSRALLIGQAKDIAAPPLDFVNRFLNSPDPATETSLDRFYGTERWRDLRSSPQREEDIVGLYSEQVRANGNFAYVTSTKILKPLHDRAYFHLIYATRNAKGIEKFRDVEKRVTTAQEQVRDAAQRENRIQRSGQEELLFGLGGDLSPLLQEERYRQRERARAQMFEVLASGPQTYERLLPLLLQIPLFWKTDFNELVMEERRAGHIDVAGMGFRQRVPNDGCIITLAGDTTPGLSNRPLLC